MLQLPMIDDNGFKEAEATAKAVTFQDMWHQLKTYQPGYVEFLKGYWAQDKTKKRDKKKYVTLIWHVLSTLNGQFLHINSSFFKQYQKMLYDGVFSMQPEVTEINQVIREEKEKFVSGQLLIDMIGENEAQPVIQLCSESLDPAVAMVIALYVTTLMQNKMARKRTALHPN